MIKKTEAFLKETFEASTYLQNNPTERDYRLEHSYRVANIAKAIAETEGFDVTNAVIAGLLHDIAYCEEMVTREDRMNHGRRSAAIARPFLESLGLSVDAVNEICYGIAIHVDDAADFDGERTSLALSVSDADNIDRFGTFRIYDAMRFADFYEMSFEEKLAWTRKRIPDLERLRGIDFATVSAKAMWLENLDYQIDFYTRLLHQLEQSTLPEEF